jgi:hypothetical protein
LSAGAGYRSGLVTTRSRRRWETGGARERSPLLGLNLGGRASYFSDERLEMRILA